MRALWACLLIGCGGGSGDGGETGNCPAFATLVDGSFARTPTTLTWTLEVAEMPATLEFDRDEVGTFILEYAWYVELDVDGDGTHDYEVMAAHFSEDREPRFAEPLSVLQSDLWRREGLAGSIAGSAAMNIEGNVVTLTVEEDEEADLALVTDPAQSSFVTQFQVTNLEACTDRL
jgi:hypothetical protein